MRRKRKKDLYPRVEPTALTSTVAIDSLKKLSTEELMSALVMAGEIEGWESSLVKGMAKDDPDNPLFEPFIAAAMHTRVAREVMAIELTLRNEKAAPPETNGHKGSGYL